MKSFGLALVCLLFAGCNCDEQAALPGAGQYPTPAIYPASETANVCNTRNLPSVESLEQSQSGK